MRDKNRETEGFLNPHHTSAYISRHTIIHYHHFKVKRCLPLESKGMKLVLFFMNYRSYNAWLFPVQLVYSYFTRDHRQQTVSGDHTRYIFSIVIFSLFSVVTKMMIIGFDNKAGTFMGCLFSWGQFAYFVTICVKNEPSLVIANFEKKKLYHYHLLVIDKSRHNYMSILFFVIYVLFWWESYII